MKFLLWTAIALLFESTAAADDGPCCHLEKMTYSVSNTNPPNSPPCDIEVNICTGGCTQYSNWTGSVHLHENQDLTNSQLLCPEESDREGQTCCVPSDVKTVAKYCTHSNGNQVQVYVREPQRCGCGPCQGPVSRGNCNVRSNSQYHQFWVHNQVCRTVERVNIPRCTGHCIGFHQESSISFLGKPIKESRERCDCCRAVAYVPITVEVKCYWFNGWEDTLQAIPNAEKEVTISVIDACECKECIKPFGAVPFDTRNDLSASYFDAADGLLTS